MAGYLLRFLVAFLVLVGRTEEPLLGFIRLGGLADNRLNRCWLIWFGCRLSFSLFGLAA
ncbi:MAG: hypothetical protein JRJ79_13110 [Deltaproteobacteria bacterium]|nr:hypothetical protein [Deltaproteobacteria bacterium]